MRMVLSADLPWRVKMEAICHLTPNVSYPLMILVSLLMLPVMIIRFYMGPLEMLLFDFPLLQLWSQRPWLDACWRGRRDRG